MLFVFIPFILLLVIAFPADAAVPEQEVLRFEILRNEKPFGFHEIRFSQDGNQVMTDISIEMTYKFGPLTLFKYRHTNREVYERGALVSLDAQTNDDGKRLFVRAEKNGKELDVKTHEEDYMAPLTALPSTYWHTLYLDDDRLINTQYGGHNRVTVERSGQDRREITGVERDVVLYDFEDLKAGNKATFIYDLKTGQWVGLEMSIRGSELRYVRQTPLTGSAEYGQDYLAAQFK